MIRCYQQQQQQQYMLPSIYTTSSPLSSPLSPGNNSTIDTTATIVPSSSSSLNPNNETETETETIIVVVDVDGDNTSLLTATPPSSNPTIQEGNDLRARALDNLSQQERDQVITDLNMSTTMSMTMTMTMNISNSNQADQVGQEQAGQEQDHEEHYSPQNIEYISKKLSELDTAIISIKSKPAYLQAKIKSPGYVRNRSFRLQFLIADSFMPHAAAQRLIAYFESKLVLFGPNKLTKDLSLNDLCPEEIQCLELGVVQRLVGYDYAGRAVVSCWPTTTRESWITTEHKLKAFWYLVNTIGNESSTSTSSSTNESSSEEDNDNDNYTHQQKGLVTVVFGKGPPEEADRTTLWKIMYLFRSIPTRVSSIHYCYDDSESSKSLVNLAIKALDPKSRARFNTIYGSHNDIVAELNTFGIGSNLLTGDPWSEEASMIIREWFASQRRKESQLLAQQQEHHQRITRSTSDGSKSKSKSKSNSNSAASASSTSSTGLPVLQTGSVGITYGRLSKNDIRQYDILFGRGKGVQAHPGNKRLRELVETHLDRYEKSSRLEKTLIAEMIVRTIKDMSGRFLKIEKASNGGGWTEVDFDTSRDKIAHAFRTQRKASSTTAVANVQKQQQQQHHHQELLATSSGSNSSVAATATTAGLKNPPPPSPPQPPSSASPSALVVLATLTSTLLIPSNNFDNKSFSTSIPHPPRSR